ncbi:Orexin receptor type 2 [Desmophyllum pertusum]|uniref:Orexin receptor type 2 n=1 Tax=Desmophyllum pertusum TaxID=174260 RepID=A0A9W9Z5F8_9CNID|nr:Orexin receptor type 2 [Desmophyllum pertusum]
MTKELITQLEAKGHKVVEVAHDAVEAIRNWLVKEKGIKNSFDSWHGGKSVKKRIQKVASGLKRDEGKTWFPELSDKGGNKCRDTFWIETFHMVILVYAAKKINFGDDTYVMRIQLAALDWNENVDREVSSLQFHQYARNPDRMAPTRILRPKSFNFRKMIWDNFFAKL